jgi:hypothetical protein
LYPEQRAGFAADYPQMGEDFEVLAEPEGRYNCIGFASGTEAEWVQLLPGGDRDATLAFYDRVFRMAYGGPYRRLPAVDVRHRPGWQKVVLYGMVLAGGELIVLHAAVEDFDGTWLSKMGEDALIRHRTAGAIAKLGCQPVVVYERRFCVPPY